MIGCTATVAVWLIAYQLVRLPFNFLTNRLELNCIILSIKLSWRRRWQRSDLFVCSSRLQPRDSIWNWFNILPKWNSGNISSRKCNNGTELLQPRSLQWLSCWMGKFQCIRRGFKLILICLIISKDCHALSWF